MNNAGNSHKKEKEEEEEENNKTIKQMTYIYHIVQISK